MFTSLIRSVQSREKTVTGGWTENTLLEFNFLLKRACLLEHFNTLAETFWSFDRIGYVFLIEYKI